MDLDETDRAAISGPAVGLRALLGLPFERELQELARIAAERAGHRPTLGLARIWIASAAGDAETAAAEAHRVAEESAQNAASAFLMASRVAVLARNPALVREVLDHLTATGLRGPTLDAQRRTAEAGLAALEGDWPTAVATYQDGLRRLQELGLNFDLGLMWLGVVATAPDGDPMAERAARDARAIFEDMGSPPYLAQLERLLGERSARAAAAGAPARRVQAQTSGSTSAV
jgi:hypothetical protein